MVDRASQMVLVVKNQPANAGDVRDAGSVPGSGRSPGGRHLEGKGDVIINRKQRCLKIQVIEI